MFGPSKRIGADSFLKLARIDPAPVRITSSTFRGLENACDVTGVTKIRKLRAWIIDMECSGEGERYDDREVFLITSDDLLLRYTSNGSAIESIAARWTKLTSSPTNHSVGPKIDCRAHRTLAHDPRRPCPRMGAWSAMDGKPVSVGREHIDLETLLGGRNA